MCGIAGFLGNFGQGLLDEMSSTIAHRGPDDTGTYRDPERGIGLAHRRLSIIDLSPAGHQPMWDTNKRAVIVFNGEIYNYRELRSDLINSGVRFRSHSDTEVLLNLYLRDGESMLSRLNGIFAFAIWDAKTDSLFLARDGLGVKPLYYAQTSKGFLFASEMKALLKDSGVAKDIDPLAVISYLTYLWCPAPHTMLECVKKLEPGHGMRVRGGSIERVWGFYDLPYQQAVNPISVQDAVNQVQQTLRQAVQRQMVADVPVGAFLSGGLDSGAVVAFAREFAGSARLQCFTIGFNGPGANEEGMTEDLPYAQRLARHLDVDLNTIYVGPEMVNHLEKMIYHLDEPQADPAPLNVLFISELARSSGIKVLLSGAGGDDIFTGYRRHYALMQEKYWAWMPGSARSRIRRFAERLPLNKPASRRFAKAFRYADLEGDERIASYFYWSPPHLVSRLCKPVLENNDSPHSATSLLISSLARIPTSTPRLNRMLYLESKHFLADHNLNYTDKMSMAAGVEVRVPLLDPDMISLAARLPVGYKQRGRTGKWIFKKAMEPYLPRDVIYRPKTGFGAPLRYWLRNPLRPVVDDVLSKESLQRRGIFDPSEVCNLIAMDRVRKTDGAYTIFALMCVELWCRIFIDGAGASL
jgi:asparagine synthase (glutamine-hydrolysing)